MCQSFFADDLDGADLSSSMGRMTNEKLSKTESVRLSLREHEWLVAHTDTYDQDRSKVIRGAVRLLRILTMGLPESLRNKFTAKLSRGKGLDELEVKAMLLAGELARLLDLAGSRPDNPPSPATGRRRQRKGPS